MKSVKLIVAGSVMALLAGCAGQGTNSANYSGNYGSSSTWGSYKCGARAGQGGKEFTGWSTNRSDAESNAMSKCRSGSQGSCQITQCSTQS